MVTCFLEHSRVSMGAKMVEKGGARPDAYDLRGGKINFENSLSTSKLRLKSKKLCILSLSFEIVSVIFELMLSIGQLEIL